MGVRSGEATGIACVLLAVAGCAAGNGAGSVPTASSSAGVGAQAYACDRTWTCAAKVAGFVGRDVLYPGDGALATSEYSAQRGVVVAPTDPRPDPDAVLVAATYTRGAAVVTLLGRTGSVSTPGQAQAPVRVPVRGVQGEVVVSPATARVTWQCDGWVWSLSAPDEETALAEAERLRSASP